MPGNYIFASESNMYLAIFCDILCFGECTIIADSALWPVSVLDEIMQK